MRASPDVARAASAASLALSAAARAWAAACSACPIRAFSAIVFDVSEGGADVAVLVEGLRGVGCGGVAGLGGGVAGVVGGGTSAVGSFGPVFGCDGFGCDGALCCVLGDAVLSEAVGPCADPCDDPGIDPCVDEVNLSRSIGSNHHAAAAPSSSTATIAGQKPERDRVARGGIRRSSNSRLTPPRRGVAADGAMRCVGASCAGGSEAAEQPAPFVDRLRPLFGGEAKATIDRGEEGRIEADRRRLGQRTIGIAADARGRFRRRLDRRWRDAAPRRRSRCRSTAPACRRAAYCSIGAYCGVSTRGERARAAADRLTRGAEVDQDRHAVAADDDVRRLDVAMQEALRMHRAQGRSAGLRRGGARRRPAGDGPARATARRRCGRPRTP